MGFDEIRVRYRQVRRAVLREVILQGLTGAALQAYVSKEARLRIPAAERPEFIQDVMEDVSQLDESRLAGLGVTPEQLAAWSHQSGK
jgi:hypothetical protein